MPKFHGDPIEEDTLYVVLYQRKAVGEAYHWALLRAGPGEAGQVHQVTDRAGPWVYENPEFERLEATRSMICLVGIGSISPEKRAAAEAAMQSVPVPPGGGTLRTGEPFNCRTWLKLAISALQKAGVLDLPLHVEAVETKLRTEAGRLIMANEQQDTELPTVTARIV